MPEKISRHAKAVWEKLSRFYSWLRSNTAVIEALLAAIGVVVISLQLYTMKEQNKIINSQKTQADDFQAYTKRQDSMQAKRDSIRDSVSDTLAKLTIKIAQDANKLEAFRLGLEKEAAIEARRPPVYVWDIGVPATTGMVGQYAVHFENSGSREASNFSYSSYYLFYPNHLDPPHVFRGLERQGKSMIPAKQRVIFTETAPIGALEAKLGSYSYSRFFVKIKWSFSVGSDVFWDSTSRHYVKGGKWTVDEWPREYLDSIR